MNVKKVKFFLASTLVLSAPFALLYNVDDVSAEGYPKSMRNTPSSQNAVASSSINKRMINAKTEAFKATYPVGNLEVQKSIVVDKRKDKTYLVDYSKNEPEFMKYEQRVEIMVDDVNHDALEGDEKEFVPDIPAVEPPMVPQQPLYDKGEMTVDNSSSAGDKKQNYNPYEITPRGFKAENAPFNQPTILTIPPESKTQELRREGFNRGSENNNTSKDIKKNYNNSFDDALAPSFFDKELEVDFSAYQFASAEENLRLPKSMTWRGNTKKKLNYIDNNSVKSSEETEYAINSRQIQNFKNSGVVSKSKIENLKYEIDKTENIEVSMEDLIAEAYSKNPELNSARASLKSIDETVPLAFSGYLPDLNIQTTNSYNNIESTGAENTLYTDTQSFNVSQELFGGGETYYAVKSAKNRVKAARYELEQIEQEFLQNAINAYIDVIFTKRVLDLSKNNEIVLREQLKAAQERFIIGDATRTDVAQSEARLANAYSDRVISEGDYTNARSNFKRVFLKDAPEELFMPTSLPDIPEELSVALKRALDNNPSVKVLEYLKKSRQSDVNATRSDLLPQLDLTGTVSRSERIVGSTPVDLESEVVTLTATFPLYTGGETFARMRQARDNVRQTEYNHANSINTVRDNVIRAWQGLNTTTSNIEATRSSLVASEYALEGVKEEQKEGARTILDVLDAEQERFVAEVNHARAIKDSLQAVYNLKTVIGELTVKELGIAVDKYDPKIHYDNTEFKFIGL